MSKLKSDNVQSVYEGVVVREPDKLLYIEPSGRGGRRVSILEILDYLDSLEGKKIRLGIDTIDETEIRDNKYEDNFNDDEDDEGPIHEYTQDAALYESIGPEKVKVEPDEKSRSIGTTLETPAQKSKEVTAEHIIPDTERHKRGRPRMS